MDEQIVEEVPAPELMTMSVTMTMSAFEELERACLRRGMPMGTLLADGFVRAIVGDHVEPTRLAWRDGLAGNR